MHKKLLSTLALCILMTSTLLGCGQGQSTASPAIFSTSGGNVSVMKAGTAIWVEAEVGMALEPGDIIKSSDNSSAEITFSDGSSIELQAGTEIEVVSLNISTETDPATIRVKQTLGRIIFRVMKIIDPASRYEVETPTGSVAIRGSAVEVYVTEDGTTSACNLEGDIWAIAQGVELQVPEGRCCVIRPGQPPELIVEVTFADPNLEAAVRQAISKAEGSIYASDLDGLTYLDASARNITDLTGLEYAASLTGLVLYDNQISDISPLASLTSLTHLYLGANQISDISPVTNLTGLTALYLYDNQIADISPLANLTSLTELALYENRISDISPLANLTDLTDLLSLGDNQISDISPLANLTSLTVLYIGDNQISDISPLANLTNLTELGLWWNQISNISPLANLTSLTGLGLWWNQISDISPLVDNDGLSEGDDVRLQGNPLSSDSINVYIPQLEARGVTVIY